MTNLSLVINAGEQLLITGKAGSGKTSLALALSGKIYAHGDLQFNYSALSKLNPEITYISQFYEFKNKSGLKDFYYQQRYNSYDSDDALTVQEILAAKNGITEEIKHLLTELNLLHRLDATLIHLSSGERKKLQLIHGLTKHSQIMIIDNPYIGLDTQSVTNLNNYLSTLASLGVTLIIIGDAYEIPSFITHVASINSQRNIDLVAKAQYLPPILETENLPALSATFKQQLVTSDVSEIIRFNQVSVVYGDKKALDTVNWHVQKGDKWLVAGHNGAGKSTLLSLIYGDHPQAYANDFSLFGRKRGSGESIWDIKHNIGYVSPELHWNFNPGLTCFEAILSGFFDTPGLYRQANQEQQEISSYWLDKLNLNEYTDTRFANASLGIQRMVLLARALVKNPPLFIFDEPCQGLDDARTWQFIELIDSLFADEERTMLYVSHRPDQIPRCISHILQLEQGSVIKADSI